MHSVLNSYEREALKNRPRKRVRVKGRRGYVMNQAATRPGQLAKANTCARFTEKIMRQIERYGYTVHDERRLQRTIALLRGLIIENKMEGRKVRATKRAG